MKVLIPFVLWNTYILKLHFENGIISVCLLSCVRLGVADGWWDLRVAFTTSSSQAALLSLQVGPWWWFQTRAKGWWNPPKVLRREKKPALWGCWMQFFPHTMWQERLWAAGGHLWPAGRLGSLATSKVTYPLLKHFWRWFSFSQGVIC